MKRKSMSVLVFAVAVAIFGLTGIAGNETEKALVTKLVSDIQGVTSVKNQLTVEEVKTK